MYFPEGLISRWPKEKVSIKYSFFLKKRIFSEGMAQIEGQENRKVTHHIH